MSEKEIKKNEKAIVSNEIDAVGTKTIREPVKKTELANHNKSTKKEIIREPVENQKNQQGVVTRCNLLNVRREPFANAEILRVIERRDKLTIIKNNGKTGVFYKVKLNDGLEGFVMKEFVDIVK